MGRAAGRHASNKRKDVYLDVSQGPQPTQHLVARVVVRFANQRGHMIRPHRASEANLLERTHGCNDVSVTIVLKRLSKAETTRGSARVRGVIVHAATSTGTHVTKALAAPGTTATLTTRTLRGD